MSLPDHLLDDDTDVCERCGNAFCTRTDGRCQDCLLDYIDLYADAAYQDKVEEK